MSTEPATRPGKRGPRPRFTRAEILRTALRLIDAGEPGSFSMRRLADELGIGVPTLYGHVRDKKELYEGVIALAFVEQPPEPAGGRPWYDDVRLVVRELHEITLRHPNLAAILLTDTKPNPGFFVRRERILTTLRKSGFPPTRALRALGVLTSYALGFAMAQGSQTLRYLPESIRQEQRAEFPGLSEVADNYATHLDTGTFDYGLDLIIQSLRSELGEPGATGS